MKLIIDIPDEVYKMYMDDRIRTIDVLHAVRYGTPLKDWLESFNTESASVCFNKIQELKGIVGAGSEKNTQGGL